MTNERTNKQTNISPSVTFYSYRLISWPTSLSLAKKAPAGMKTWKLYKEFLPRASFVIFFLSSICTKRSHFYRRILFLKWSFASIWSMSGLSQVRLALFIIFTISHYYSCYYYQFLFFFFFFFSSSSSSSFFFFFFFFFSSSSSFFFFFFLTMKRRWRLAHNIVM